MNPSRMKIWLMRAFGVFVSILIAVTLFLAPRSSPVGSFREISGVVVSIQAVGASKLRPAEVYVTVRLEDASVVLATVAGRHHLPAGTAVTVRRYERKFGLADHEVVAIRPQPGLD